MVVGLVRDPDPGPGAQPPPGPRRVPHLPWRPFAAFALWCWLFVLAGAVDGLAGYALVLVALALGCWRLDRWLGRQYWGGLRETQRL